MPFGIRRTPSTRGSNVLRIAPNRRRAAIPSSCWVAHNPGQGRRRTSRAVHEPDVRSAGNRRPANVAAVALNGHRRPATATRRTANDMACPADRIVRPAPTLRHFGAENSQCARTGRGKSRARSLAWHCWCWPGCSTAVLTQAHLCRLQRRQSQGRAGPPASELRALKTRTNCSSATTSN